MTNNETVRRLATQWLVCPTGLPLIRRRCSNCKSAHHRAYGKFRVNANHKLLDVWLLALCVGCGATVKLTVLERVRVALTAAGQRLRPRELATRRHPPSPATITAMEWDEFWALVDRHGADLDELTAELASRNETAITGFEDRLADLLHALDTPRHAAAARARNDAFLYIRCGAVVAGRTRYERVLTDPGELRRFRLREQEDLLYVASTAYERSTGRPWRYEATVSYESGTNTDAWGEPATTPDGDAAEPEPIGLLFARWLARRIKRDR
jgi:hypothetical protein